MGVCSILSSQQEAAPQTKGTRRNTARAENQGRRVLIKNAALVNASRWIKGRGKLYGPPPVPFVTTGTNMFQMSSTGKPKRISKESGEGSGGRALGGEARCGAQRCHAEQVRRIYRTDELLIFHLPGKTKSYPPACPVLSLHKKREC